MTFQQFNTLNQHIQHENLIQNGNFLADMTTEDYQALLFELNGFFVEVTLNKQEDEVLGLNSFKDLKELEPYRQLIN